MIEYLSHACMAHRNQGGYTLQVSSNKGLIGCESPEARGAKPHPARFAAFLFSAPFGGPDGRARALPVTLRVPRSLTPIRAAAQCESWSAVVHMAQLETNMAQIINHPNAHLERVTQTRINGRLPRTVTNLRTYRRECQHENNLKNEAEKAISSARTTVAILGEAFRRQQFELALLLQQGGQS